MKRQYSSMIPSKKRLEKQLPPVCPTDLTLNLLKQFARVYTVAKSENGTTVDLFQN